MGLMGAREGEFIMSMIIWIIGLLMGLAGILFVIKPEAARFVMRFMRQGNRIYVASVLRIIIAVIFLSGARESGVPWLIMLLGVLILVAGMLGFAIGREKQQRLVAWWEHQPAVVLRLVGMIPIVMGGLVVWGALS